jgi:fermentation-respiration switch protein FrsA (DUF1100 family)
VGTVAVPEEGGCGAGGMTIQARMRPSPLAYVRPNPPPVLAIHGMEDAFVPLDHVTRATARVREPAATLRKRF